jgi:hypothetical protein
MPAMPAESLIDLSAAELAARMRRHESSPVEVIDAHLERIRLANPRLNAIVTLLVDQARVQNRLADVLIPRAAAQNRPGRRSQRPNQRPHRQGRAREQVRIQDQHGLLGQQVPRRPGPAA